MKKVILIGVSQLLIGCGIIGAPIADVGYGGWASDADISSSLNAATVRGGSRQLVTTFVTCRINHPVKTKKLTFDSGRTSVAVRCTDSAAGKGYNTNFYFNAIPGHDYVVHMKVAPWNRSIELVDETDNGSIIDSKSVHP